MHKFKNVVEEHLAALFAPALSEELSLDKVVGIVSSSLSNERWRRIEAADFYVLEIRPEYVVLGQCDIEAGDMKFFRVPYTIDDAQAITWGEWEQIVRVVEYRMMDGSTLEDAARRAGMVLEGWLPSGTSQNDLDDGDFGWLSDKYRSASAEQKAKMNKADSRKLPYKVHGEVSRDGWKAAWLAAVGSGARAMKSYAGGPNQATVLKKLRRDKPKGINVASDNTFKDEGSGGSEEAASRLVLFTLEDAPQIVEDTVDGQGRRHLTYIGTALVDNVLSANDRFYTREGNDRAMASTNQYTEEGGVVTVYSRHGKAVPSPDGALPTGLPVGKVVEPLWRDDTRIRYKATISPTTEGQDVMILLEDGVMFASSIRSRPGSFKVARKKVNGKEVDVVMDAVIHGIDLAEAPGIPGAGIDEILAEEAVVVEDLTPEGDKDHMDPKELTLKFLKDSRPDLVQALTEEVQSAGATQKVKADLDAATAALAEIQKANTALTEELTAAKKTAADAQAALEASNGKVVGLEKDLAGVRIAGTVDAALSGKKNAKRLRSLVLHGGFVVEEEGKEVVVAAPATVEEVAAVLARAEAYLKSLVEELRSTGKTSFKGIVKDEADETATESAEGEEDEKEGAMLGIPIAPLTEEEVATYKRLSA